MNKWIKLGVYLLITLVLFIVLPQHYGNVGGLLRYFAELLVVAFLGELVLFLYARGKKKKQDSN
jgi:hypothetical protein